MSDGEPVDLRRGAALLPGGPARGLQVRYRHDGALWVDTLMAAPDGHRLTRLRVPG